MAVLCIEHKKFVFLFSDVRKPGWHKASRHSNNRAGRSQELSRPFQCRSKSGIPTFFTSEYCITVPYSLVNNVRIVNTV